MTSARELYNKKKYNLCLRKLYEENGKAKMYVWGLVLLSLLLDGILIYMKDYIATIPAVGLSVGIIAGIAVGVGARAVGVVVVVAVGLSVGIIERVAGSGAGAVLVAGAVALIIGAVGVGAVGLIIGAGGAVGLIIGGAGAEGLIIGIIAVLVGLDKFIFKWICKRFLG